MNFKILSLILSFYLLSFKLNAQVPANVYSKLVYQVGSYFVGQGGEMYHLPRFKNKAYVFGLAISINQLGVVDKVSFSNKSPMLDSLVSFSTVEKRIREEKMIYKSYKSSTLIALVYIRRSYDEEIINLAEFDKAIFTAMPDISQMDRNRKTVLIPSLTFIAVKGKP